jgi:N-acetylneuraminic acid mutarotase
MKLFNVLALTAITSILATTVDASEWRPLASAPQALMGLHAEVVDDKIYTFGGQVVGAGFGEPTNQVAVLDIHTGNWSEAPPMPTRRGFLGTGVVDGLIYVIGGSPNMREFDPATDVVEIYNPVNNEWRFAPGLPTGRADLTASVVDGRIYAIGGTEHVAVDALGVVEMYDPSTGAWTRRADMPTPRLHLTSVAFNGEIYVFGGGPEWPVPLPTLEIYNPATNTWRKGADMPTPRTGLWAAVLNGKIYVAGGLSWENEALATVEVYDPATDTWDTIPDMPTARFLAAVRAVAGKLYVIGGSQTDYRSLDVVEVYDPAP